MITKLAGLKNSLWTALLVVATFFALVETKTHWVEKLALIEQIIYGFFVVAILFSAQFSKSRFAILSALLCTSYLILEGMIPGKLQISLHQSWLYLSLIFTFVYLAYSKDRGLFSIHSFYRLFGIFLCIVAAKGWLEASDYLLVWLHEQKLIVWGVQYLKVELPIICSVVLVLWRSLKEPSLLVAALLSSLIVSTLYYFQQLALPLSVIYIVLLSHYILVAVIDSYYLAYRDELTGIPSRRALNQYALSLSSKYTLAMMDIDHFKKFNDTYGHDIGDQVLRLVASKLNQVKGGGRVFRYGGEEFTVIFPRKTAQQAAVELERLRQLIADYKIVIRQPVRQSKKSRANKPTETFKNVSVTISIGVAMRQPKQNFEQTIKQADEALYRAKKNGRNNVSY